MKQNSICVAPRICNSVSEISSTRGCRKINLPRAMKMLAVDIMGEGREEGEKRNDIGSSNVRVKRDDSPLRVHEITSVFRLIRECERACERACRWQFHFKTQLHSKFRISNFPKNFQVRNNSISDVHKSRYWSFIKKLRNIYILNNSWNRNLFFCQCK